MSTCNTNQKYADIQEEKDKSQFDREVSDYKKNKKNNAVLKAVSIVYIGILWFVVL